MALQIKNGATFFLLSGAIVPALTFVVLGTKRFRKSPDISGKIKSLSGKINSDTRSIVRWKICIYTVFAQKANYEFKWTILTNLTLIHVAMST